MNQMWQMLIAVVLCAVCWVAVTVTITVMTDVITGAFIGGWSLVAILFLAIYYYKAHIRAGSDETGSEAGD